MAKKLYRITNNGRRPIVLPGASPNATTIDVGEHTDRWLTDDAAKKMDNSSGLSCALAPKPRKPAEAKIANVLKPNAKKPKGDKAK